MSLLVGRLVLSRKRALIFPLMVYLKFSKILGPPRVRNANIPKAVIQMIAPQTGCSFSTLMKNSILTEIKLIKNRLKANKFIIKKKMRQTINNLRVHKKLRNIQIC